MKKEPQLSPNTIYEMVAEAGFRKYFHLGGLQATQELMDLCHLDSTKYVLDVGCASGRTACYIAGKYGSRVVGVDLLPKMVARSYERASREGVEGRVRFSAGNALDLPLAGNLFDLVIGEFITGLLDDKRRAVAGYHRVLKPGGTLALNEATWIKSPPPADLVASLSKIFGFRSELLSPVGWQALLESSGFNRTTVKTHQAASLSNPREDIADLLVALPRVVRMIARSSTFRSFIREALLVPKDLLEYFGYGLYVCVKPE